MTVTASSQGQHISTAPSKKLLASHCVALILYLSHYCALPGHPMERCTYKTMDNTFIDRSCEWCVQTCTQKPLMRSEKSKVMHKRKLQRLPAARPLELADLDILGPLPRTTTKDQHVVIITNWVSKLTRAIPPAQINSMEIETIFSNNWVIPYEIPS